MAFTTHIDEEPNVGQVLLATALIKIEHNNRSLCVRALIDQISTTNLITYGACKSLNLHEKRVDIPITGLGGKESYKVRTKTNSEMKSLVNDRFSMNIPALVVARITTLRALKIKDEWDHLKGLQLADHITHNTNRIEVLLGAATFARILLQGFSQRLSGTTNGSKNRTRLDCVGQYT